MNLSQSDFYVLATHILDNEIPDQKTITLSSLLILKPAKCQFGEIWNAIQSVCQYRLICEYRKVLLDIKWIYKNLILDKS